LELQKIVGADAGRSANERKAIVEPVFARVKQAMGFRRWTVRRLENVRTQWALLCAVLNLIKMYQHWAAGELVAA
jgi:hypothetical protein